MANRADELFKLGYKVIITHLTTIVLVSPRNSVLKLISIRIHDGKNLLRANVKLRTLVEKFKLDVVHNYKLIIEITI